MNRILSMFFVIFLALNSWADQKLGISGRLSDNQNIPVTESNVSFKVKIKIVNCVVYEETQVLDLSNSQGFFSFPLGLGIVDYNAGPSIFAEAVLTCQDSSTTNVNSSTVRLLELSVKKSAEPTFTVFSAEPINSVAFSKNSEFLQGKSLSNFIQVSTSTTQFVIDQLTSGVSGLYIKASELASALSDYYLKTETDSLLDLKLTKTSNLSDLANVTTARFNLGLGTLATQSSVSNADIVSLDYSKLTGVPSTFSPSAHIHGDADITSLDYSKLTNVPSSFSPSSHIHAISDITNLQTALNGKLNTTDIPSCNANQTLNFTVPTGYQCILISIANTQVSGLGTLSTKSIVADADITSLSYSKLTGVPSTFAPSAHTHGDADITALAYSKLTGVPSTFAPSAHTHLISDVINLQTSLDAKLSLSAIPTCTASQTAIFTSPAGYACVAVAIENTQVSGLGTLATKSSVLDADIVSMSGLKLTGPLLIGTTATCDTSGVTRYTGGSLEICNGTAFVKIQMNDRDVYASYVRNTAQAITTAGTKIIWTTQIEASHPSAMNTTTGDFTCPIAGVYQIIAQSAVNTNGSLEERVFVNGIECAVGRDGSSGGTINVFTKVSCLKRCAAGQIIFIRATPSSNLSTLATANANFVQILKVAD